MESKSEISLDFTNNDDLSEAFSRKDVGDTFEISIKGVIKTKDLKGVKGVIKEIELDGDDDKGPVVPSNSKPAAIAVMPMMLDEEE